MGEQLNRPVNGIAHCADTDMSKWAARDSRGVAKRLTSTDHADGRHVVAARGSKGPPVLIQRAGCDELAFNAPVEQLLVDGTSATFSSLSSGTPVAVSALPVPGDAVPDRAPSPQPQAPQAITPIPVAPSHLVSPIPAGATLDKVAGPAPAKKMVTIQGEAIGKFRVFCQDVIVSEKLLILCYPLDGSTAIIEPPNTEELLRLTVDNQNYTCAARDMSFEYQGTLMVVLIRAS